MIIDRNYSNDLDFSWLVDTYMISSYIILYPSSFVTIEGYKVYGDKNNLLYYYL